MKTNTDISLLILRISTAFLMLLHGINKVFNGIDPIKNMLVSKNIPEFFAYGVYVGEVIAPLLMIIGFRTKIASAVFFINCVVAALLAHSSDIFTLTKTGGWAIELLGLYAFASLALIFSGG